MSPVTFDKGRVFRLIRPQNVTNGLWYVIVECKGCNQPIYLISDPSGGRERQPFVGEGMISVPCHSCYHDANYNTSDARPYQAPADVIFRTPKSKPSGRPRQPISKRFPQLKPTFTAEWLEDRPDAAAAIGRCVALWTEVEYDMAWLLAKMLGANEKAAAAVFLTLRSSRAQADALNAAARVVLDKRDHELYEAIMSLKSAAENERNHLAHGVYGGAYQVADGVLWIDPTDRIQNMIDMGVDKGEVTPVHLEWVRQRTYVYDPSDIETVAAKIADCRDQIRAFTGYLSAGDAAWRAHRYAELCQHPATKERLAIIRNKRRDKYDTS